jgi:UPF0755 protein
MRVFGAGLLLLLAVAAAAWAGAAWWLHQPLALARDPVEVTIEPGATAREVAQAWVQGGVQVSPRWLYEWFRWSGEAKRIRAGTYQIGAGTTPIALLDKMVRGDVVMASVRLLEGWTFRQFRTELARSPDLKATTAALSEAQIMAQLGAPDVPAEGRFFPDTYSFGKGTTDLVVLKRAYQAMEQQLAAAWAERAPDTPLKSPEEALKLASIIEKETGAAGERGQVASVFVNRLRIGMPLQTDPTIIYGLGEKFDGNLRKRDLVTDGPYNTYLRPGLPPTPIAMPGKASLRAAVRPDDTRWLYFVARGNGTSQFSENLADHNRAVNQFQRGGRP